MGRRTPMAYSGYRRQRKQRNIYYVYLHHTLDGEILYIGKGKNGRAYEVEKRARFHENWFSSILEGGRSLSDYITFYKNGLSEREAEILETAMIRCIGPVYDRSGLWNNWLPERDSVYETSDPSVSDLDVILSISPDEFIEDSRRLCEFVYRRVKYET